MGEFDWWLLVIVPAVVGLATAYSQRFIDLVTRWLWQGLRRRRAWAYQQHLLAVINHIGLGTFHVRLFRAAVKGIACMFIGLLLALSVPQAIFSNKAIATVADFGRLEWIVWVGNLAVCTGLAGYAGAMLHMSSRYAAAFVDPSDYVQRMRARILRLVPETETDELDGVAQLARGIVLRRERQLVSLLNEQA